MTAAAAEDVALDMAVEELHMGLSGLVDAGIAVDNAGVVGAFVPDGAAPDRTDLAAAVEAAADGAAVHLHVGDIHVAVDHVAAAEDVAGLFNGIGCLVVEFFDILVVGRLPLCRLVLVAVTDVSVVDGQVGGAIDRAALTATVGITLDGGDAVVEAGAVHLTDGHIGYSRGLCCSLLDGCFHEFSVNGVMVFAHRAQVTAAIDVTGHAAFDIDVGGCREVLQVELVEYRTSFATAIDVPVDVTAL